jgi:hypothetical protein
LLSFSAYQGWVAYTITPRTVMVIELIARLVSVKTVIHWTTDMSAWSLNKECELTSSDTSEKEDRRPDITIPSAPHQEKQRGLTQARSL